MIRWFTALFLICSAQIAAAQNTVTPQIGGGIGYGFDGGVSFASAVNLNCSQATTYIAALTGPTAPEQAAYKLGICSMVAHGTFPLIDILYIHIQQSAANAKVNAVAPGTHNAVQTGTVTFVADAGLTGDSTTGFFITGLNPSTAGGTLNAWNSGVCITNSRAVSQNWVAFGSDDAVPNQTYFEPFTGTSAGGAINDMGGDNVANANAQGSWIFTRTGAAASAIYKGGVATGSASGTATGLPNAVMYEFAFNSNGTAANFTGDTHAYFFAGHVGISASQAASIFNDLGAMLSALGVSGCGGPSSAGPFFFNSATGNDVANTCLVSGSPCQTIAKLNALRYSAGADITLTGAGFTGCIALSPSNVSSSSVGSPINLHGTGTLTSTCGGAASGGNGPKTGAIVTDCINAVINGLTIRGSGLVSGSATQFGIVPQNSCGGAAPTVIIENVDCSGFSAVGATGDSGACIYASNFSEAAGFPGACGSIIVQVINATLHGATNAAADDNGINGAGGTGCQPAAVTLTVQGTIVNNIGGRAAAPNGTSGNGIIWANAGPGSAGTFILMHDLGWNMAACGGPAGKFKINSNGVVTQFGEGYKIQPSSPSSSYCDFAANDDDISAASSLTEYDYSHDNAGPAWLMFNPGGSNVIRYSISENDQGNQSATGSNDGGGTFAVGSNGAGSFWAAYNLTIYLSAAGAGSTPPSCASFGFSGTYGGGLYANNACKNFAQDTFARTYNLNGNNGAAAENTINIVNNNYDNAGSGTLSHATGWSPGNAAYASVAAMNAATGQEANSKTIASGFNSPPTGTCTWTPSSTSTWPPSGCPAAYSTVAGGLKSAGADLAGGSFPTYFSNAFLTTTAGVRDYYATTILGTGGCYNIGAYGVCP